MENLDKATNIEVAIHWANHIENPCGIMVNGEWKSIRNSYILECKENIIPLMENPLAIKYLQDVIKKYKQS